MHHILDPFADFHVFGREIGQMLMLAVPGVIISSLLTAAFAMYAFPFDWNFSTAMTFGSMMSATDPVAGTYLFALLSV